MLYGKFKIVCAIDVGDFHSIEFHKFATTDYDTQKPVVFYRHFADHWMDPGFFCLAARGEGDSHISSFGCRFIYFRSYEEEGSRYVMALLRNAR